MDFENALIPLCREFIRIPSFSGREKDAAMLMENTMKTYGYDEVHVDRLGSVYGIINGKHPGKTILLDGHIDHVDVTDTEKWTHDPFGAEIAEGRLYGRGTSDMKCSVAAMVSAAAAFAQKTDREFAGRVCVSCSVHEETFEGVASKEMTEALEPDCVIIGEATSGTMKIGQRGRAEIVVETEGVSCHSANPEKGINAVEHMMELLGEIKKIVPPKQAVLGHGIMALTDIISSPYPGASVIPSSCRATFDRRTLVGETWQTVLEPIEQAIERTKKKIPNLKAKAYIAEGSALCWTGCEIKAKRFFDAWLMDEDDMFVRKALQGLKNAGIEPLVSHFGFCTNGSHFCGERGIPTIGYGPSMENLAHVRDEYIEIKELERAFHGYIEIMRSVLSL